jgi:hypothetical protein
MTKRWAAVLLVIGALIAGFFLWDSLTPVHMRSREPAPGGDAMLQPHILMMDKKVDGGVFSFQVVGYVYEGKPVLGAFYPEHADALAFLKTKVPPGTKVLAWWDYGSEIRVFGGHEPVAVSLQDPDIPAVAAALTEVNPSMTRELMRSLGAETLFVTIEDSVFNGKGQIMTGIASGDTPARDERGEIRLGRTGYVAVHGDTLTTVIPGFSGDEVPQAAGSKIIERALAGEEIPGFLHVYADDFVVIYTIKK